MCSIQTKQRLHNTNRVIITALSTAGLLIDGYQFSDIILGVGVIIWVWLPECDKLEEIALDKLLFALSKIRAGINKNYPFISLQKKIIK